MNGLISYMVFPNAQGFCRFLAILMLNISLSSLAEPSKAPLVKEVREARKTKDGKEIVEFKSEEEALAYISEAFRLIDIGSPEDLAINRILNEKLVKRFNIKDLKKPVRFYISTLPTKNAFALKPSFSSYVVVMSRDLLAGTNVDRAAFVAGHELTHHRLDTDENSKGEEYVSDINSVRWMSNATPPFNLDAAIEMSKNLFLPDKNNQLPDIRVYFESLLKIIDVHGIDRIRVAEVQNTATVIEQNRGGTSVQETKWPTEFQALLNSGKHTGYVDQFLASRGYADASVLKKLSILTDLINSIDEYQARVRAADAFHELEKIESIDITKPEINRAFDALVDAVIVNPWLYEWYNHSFQGHIRYYEVLMQMAFGKKSFRPAGTLKKLRPLLREFVAASTFPEAKAAAINLQAFLKTNSVFSRIYDYQILQLMNWGQGTYFEVSELDHLRASKKTNIYHEKIDGSWEPVVVPWQEFVEWSKWSSDVADSLWDLGVRDPRTFKLMSFDHRSSIIRQPLSSFFLSKSTDRATKPSITKGPRMGQQKLRTFSVYADTRLETRVDMADTFAITDEGYLSKIDRSYVKRFLIRVLEAEGRTYSEAQEKDLTTWTVNEPRQWFTANIGQAIIESHKNFRDLFEDSKIDPRLDGIRYLDPNLLERIEAELFIQLNNIVISHASLANRHKDANYIEYVEEVGRFLKQAEKLMREKGIDSTFSKRFKKVVLEHFVRAEEGSIEAENPVVGFVVDENEGLFTLTEKLNLFHHTKLLYFGTRLFDLSGGHRFSLSRLRSMFGYTKPTTKKQLIAAVKKLLDVKHKNATNFAMYETVLFIDSHSKIQLDIASIFDAKEENLKNEFKEGRVQYDDDELTGRDVLTNYVEHDAHWSTLNLESKVKSFVFYSRASLFSYDYKYKHKILEAIINQILNEPLLSSRISYLSKLLTEPRIADPALRNKVIVELVNGLFEDMGHDNSTPEFLRKLQTVWSEIKGNINSADKMVVISSLATRILAQRGSAFYLRDQIIADYSKEGLKSADPKIRAAEVLETISATDPDARLEIFKFLFAPLTESSLDIFLRAAESGHSKVKMEIEHFLDQIQDVGIDSIFSERSEHRSWAALFYQNFWSHPFELRTLMVERLLDVGSSERNFEEAFDIIEKRMFPPGTEYASEAREILKAYLGVLKIGHKSLFLSALMATADQAEQKRTSAGEKLAMILELMGPAEIKLGQQINSYPQTPEDIRKPAGRLKTNAREPLRWEIFEIIDEIVPKREQKRILRVGEVLGSASYFITVAVDTTAKGHEVLSILRPWAKERADRGFENLVKFLDQFKGDPSLKDAILDLTKQAQKNAAVETGHKHVAKQFGNAGKIYTGKQVTVVKSIKHDHPPLQVEFEFVNLLSAAPGYRRMSRAGGVHFSDLPSDTPEQKALKQDVAIAYLLMEFYAILRGYEFDHDRHGGQMRVEVTGANKLKIGLFDAGAMALDPPTDAMREALGRLWFECILELYARQSSGDTDLGKIILEKRRAFSNELKATLKNEEREKFDDYLISVEKALLTLGEYIQEFEGAERTDVLSSIIRTLLKNGLIHPKVKAGFDSKGESVMGEVFYKQLLEHFKSEDGCSRTFILGNFGGAT